VDVYFLYLLLVDKLGKLLNENIGAALLAESLRGFMVSCTGLLVKSIVIE